MTAGVDVKNELCCPPLHIFDYSRMFYAFREPLVFLSYLVHQPTPKISFVGIEVLYFQKPTWWRVNKCLIALHQ